VAQPKATRLPEIRHAPGVCGGAARIGNHRITVWVLDILRRQGVPDSEILEDSPLLTPQDLAVAWDYADSHRDEIDRDIDRNEQYGLARFYFDEDAKDRMAMELRRLGHDVITATEDGRAGRRIPDRDVLRRVPELGRAVVTSNRVD